MAKTKAKANGKAKGGKGKAKARPEPKAKAAAKAKPKAKAAAQKPVKDEGIEAVSELVSLLACSNSTANALGLSCEDVIDRIDVAVGYAAFTAAAYKDRGGAFGEIGDVASELLVEFERHAATLSGLLDRIAPHAEHEAPHDHDDLDPHDVLARLQPLLEEQNYA